MNFLNKKQSLKKVLAISVEITHTPTSTLSPTQTPTFTPTITPSPKPTSSPTPSPSPSPIPQPIVNSEEIQNLLERFSGQYGVDVNILRHIAVCESGFNPLAINGAYAGLFQFNKSTWENNRRLMGEEISTDLRFNAEESIQTAAFIVSKGKTFVWPNCYPK